MWSDVTARLAERHRDDVALETVVRGAANSGIPRARAVMACLDLRRRDDALWMRHDPTSAEQVHLIERVLDPGAYAHLVGRCGWTHELYWRWLNGELARARRWRLP